jgi:hypothetical protein
VTTSNSTNINETNNHPSSQTIVHKKEHDTQFKLSFHNEVCHLLKSEISFFVNVKKHYYTDIFHELQNSECFVICLQRLMVKNTVDQRHKVINYCTQKRAWHMMLEIQILAWVRHKNVALHWLRCKISSNLKVVSLYNLKFICL